jgi:DNA-binding SARP family transcriptional activator
MSGHADKPGHTGPALAVLTWTVVLALLWVLRPPLPHLDSAGSVSGIMLEESIEFIAWALLALVILRHSHQALHVLAERPSRRRLAENDRLQRLLASSALATGPPRSYKRYRRPLKLVDHRRLDDDGHGTDYASNHPQTTSSPTNDRRTADRPAIRILLLGPFEIEGVGHASLRTTGQQMIAYLALRTRGATRDQLIEAVWPGEDPHGARHRLYQNISEARKLLGHALISKRSHYRLDRHKIAVDIDELQRLLTEADAIGDPKIQRPKLEHALLLFRGEPLAGWDYEWAADEVRPLRSTHAELLERVGHARLLTGDAHGALQAAQHGLALDAYSEGLWRLAMQAEGRLGLRDAVSQRYQQLRDLLSDELGLEPERATRALYHELLGQR